METDFKIKTQGFEGPLELLLDLIERRKLHISDVSLSRVADDFIEHIKKFEKFPIQDSADFILIASTLILIKSKSLLPVLELTEEEQGSIEDLEKRLILYKKFKELSKNIEAIFGKKQLYFSEESKEIYSVFTPTSEITPLNILENIKSVIQNIPRIEKLSKVVVQKVVSLEEMIESLTERVSKSMKMSFRDFSKHGSGDKVTVIISFLAMLELVKQGIVRVNQENNFTDIEIESESVSVPHYS